MYEIRKLPLAVGGPVDSAQLPGHWEETTMPVLPARQCYYESPMSRDFCCAMQMLPVRGVALGRHTGLNAELVFKVGGGGAHK